MSITKSIILSFLLLISTGLAGDIKPAEIRETVIIGAGPSIRTSMQACNAIMRNSGNTIVSVANRNSQSTGQGWITTYTVRYKVVH